MKKIVVGIAISTLILAGTTYGAISDPGSKEDPIVTKSYVDKKIAELGGSNSNTSYLEEQVKAQQQVLDLLLEQMNQLQPGASSNQTYELVSMSQGQRIIGDQGTEMILRSGKGSVIGSINGGIQDVTEGVDLQDGDSAPKYHLMIIPRTEGRGIFAETDIIVMVRGGYTIQ